LNKFRIRAKRTVMEKILKIIAVLFTNAIAYTLIYTIRSVANIIPAIDFLSQLLEVTLYNILSTPFAMIARGIIEGHKYYKFFSEKFKGENANIFNKMLGVCVGIVMGIAGAGLGVVREFGKALELEMVEIGSFISKMLGKDNSKVSASLSFGFSLKAFIYTFKFFNKYLTEKLGSKYSSISKVIAAIPSLISALLTHIASLITAPIMYTLSNLIDYFEANEDSINVFKTRAELIYSDTYLKGGHIKASASNALYSHIILVKETAQNIVGSFSSIFEIMKTEVNTYAKWGNISKEDSYRSTKVLGAVTGLISGIGGAAIGLVEGIADSIEFQTIVFANFLSRLQGERVDIKNTEPEVSYSEVFLSDQYRINNNSPDLKMHDNVTGSITKEYTKNLTYTDFRDTLGKRQTTSQDKGGR
ncbi:MAG: hypothetical protein ACK4OM_01250, partial [Alphaproteobacteria bacterium]